MFDSGAIDDIAYLSGKQEETERESKGGESGGVGSKKRPGGSTYRDQDSAGGRIYRPKLSPEIAKLQDGVEDGKPPRVGRGRRFAEGLTAGEVISAKHARKLSQGKDPVTGEKIIPTACAFHEKFEKYPEQMKGKKKPTAAYDNTMSGVEKDLSAIWADTVINGDKKAKAIENAIMAATAVTNQYILDNKIAKGRRVTKDESGKRVEVLVPVVDFITADYLHCTNRNNEPQLHTHSLMFNMGVREDGTVGAINNIDIHYMRPVLDSVFKAELYHQIRQIEGFENIEIIKGDKGIRIGGVKQELVDGFSTRTQEIDDYLEARGLDTQSRRNRQIAAKASRKSKDDAPSVSELVDHWKRVIDTHTDGQGIIAGLTERKLSKESHDEKMLRLGDETVQRLKLNLQTLVDERDVLAAAYRASIGELAPAQVPELIHLVKSAFLVAAEYDDDDRRRWGIRDLVDRELSFMRMVSSMDEVPPMGSEAQIAAILDKHKPDPEKGVRGLNHEQVAGIQYLLRSTSPLTLFNGAAGSGKTFTMALVKEIAEESGFDVYGIAPAHKAAGILRDELQLKEEMSTACAKWIAQHKAGKVHIDAKTVVIIDEAGMMGIEEAEYILRAVRAEGGRVHMLGDVQQVAPVAAGSPMTLAMRINGAHRLNIIMRQKNDSTPETKRLTARMREASALFVKAEEEGIYRAKKGNRDDPDGKSKGVKINPHIKAALEIYRDEGRISYCDDAQKTYHAVADKYKEYLAIEKDPKEILIITNRNSCIHAINKEARATLIEQGYLGTSEIAFQAYTRNNREDEVGHRIRFRARDRAIFGGKQLDPEQTGIPFQINNSDMFTVVDVYPGKDGEEPSMDVEFDKQPGVIRRVKPSQLVSHDRFSDRKPLPVIQHAYAVTVHASQGATVNRAIVADVYGLDYRLSYVGMTRHRHEVHVYANIGRMEDTMLAKAGVVIVEEDGRLSIPHKDKDEQMVAPEDFKMGPDQWFGRLVYEASITDNKKNFTDQDLYKDPEALADLLIKSKTDDWLIGHIRDLQAKTLGEIDMRQQRILDNASRKGASLAADRNTVKPVEGTQNPFRDLKAPSLVPDIDALKSTGGNDMETESNTVQKRVLLRSQVKPPAHLLEAARKRAAEMAAAPVVESVEREKHVVAPKAEPRISNRISEAEFHRFVREDPISVMEKNGAVRLATRDGGNQYEMCDGGDKSRTYTVTKLGSGVWAYNQFKSPASGGTILDWMVNKGGSTSKIEAAHKLRAHYGTDGLRDKDYAPRPQAEKPKSTYESYRDTVSRQLASTGFPKTAEMPKAEDRLQAAVDHLKQREAVSKANPDDETLRPTNIERLKGNTAQRMLADIAKGDDPEANKFDKQRAEDVRKLVDRGGSCHEYRFKYQMEKPWATDTYAKERGLERETILFFDGDVKRESFKDQKSGEWRTGLTIAHRDVNKFGTVTGLEIKRQDAYASSGELMKKTKFSDGEGKGLGMLGNKMKGEKDGPKSMVFLESGVDALSHWQETKLPQGFKTKPDAEKADIVSKIPKDRLMLSVAGTVSGHAAQGIEILAKANPQAKCIIAPDNDLAGRLICKNISAAILRGNPKAEIEIQAPENMVFKDWNDQTRQLPRSPEDLQKTADDLKLSTEFIKDEVARYQEAHPDRDMTAYRDIGSKEADAAEQKQAVEFLMTADDKQVREYIAEKRIEVSGPVREERDADAAAQQAVDEMRARQQREEEDRQRQGQRM
ncbi:MobF family relaxase [Mesorhizobium sp. A623]